MATRRSNRGRAAPAGVVRAPQGASGVVVSVGAAVRAAVTAASGAAARSPPAPKVTLDTITLADLNRLGIDELRRIGARVIKVNTSTWNANAWREALRQHVPKRPRSEASAGDGDAGKGKRKARRGAGAASSTAPAAARAEAGAAVVTAPAAATRGASVTVTTVPKGKGNGDGNADGKGEGKVQGTLKRSDIAGLFYADVKYHCELRGIALRKAHPTKLDAANKPKMVARQREELVKLLTAAVAANTPCSSPDTNPPKGKTKKTTSVPIIGTVIQPVVVGAGAGAGAGEDDADGASASGAEGVVGESTELILPGNNKFSNWSSSKEDGRLAALTKFRLTGMHIPRIAKSVTRKSRSACTLCRKVERTRKTVGDMVEITEVTTTYHSHEGRTPIRCANCAVSLCLEQDGASPSCWEQWHTEQVLKRPTKNVTVARRSWLAAPRTKQRAKPAAAAAAAAAPAAAEKQSVAPRKAAPAASAGSGDGATAAAGAGAGSETQKAGRTRGAASS